MTTLLRVPDEAKVDPSLYHWMAEVARRLNEVEGITWDSVSKEFSSIRDLEQRSHHDLTDVSPVDPTSSNAERNKHVSNLDIKTLVDRVAANVATLGGSISNPPTQGEVTAIRDKVNALINALVAAGLMAPP